MGGGGGGGYKIRTGYETRALGGGEGGIKRGLGIKHGLRTGIKRGLGIKHKLRTRYKTRTGYKTRR